MSRKIYQPQMEIDPNTRQVVDLTKIACEMDSSEAIELIGKESALQYTVLASEYDVSDEMLKEIFFTDPVSEDLLYFCDNQSPDTRTIDVKTFTDPDTGLMNLQDVITYAQKDEYLIATPGSNYIIVASVTDFLGESTVVLYVWDLRKSYII